MQELPSIRVLFARAAVGALGIGALGGCGGGEPDCPPPPEPVTVDISEGSITPIKVSGHDINLAYRGGVIRLRDVEGRIISMRDGEPPVLDEPSTYAVRVEHAEVGLPLEGLEDILSRTTRKGKAAMKNLDIYLEGELLVIEGTIRPGSVFVPMHFTLKAALFATEGGTLGIRADEMSLIGIDVDQVFDTFDVTLDDILRLDEQPGLYIEENTLFANVVAMVEKPRLDAFLADVKVLPDGIALVVTDGEGPRRSVTLDSVVGASATSKRNGLTIEGGNLRFGNVELIDAYIEVEDQDNCDPLLISAANAQEQMRAGYTKMLDQGGIRLLVPDYDDVDRDDVLNTYKDDEVAQADIYGDASISCPTPAEQLAREEGDEE